MDVTGTSAASAGSTAAGSTAAEEPAGASPLSSDFETFLRMLTVQMENQDPLNPVQSADFAVQLATFSGVEQQVRTNDLLAQMVAGDGLGGLGDLAGWVGMEARGPVAATYDGSPVTVWPDLPTGTDQATLRVLGEAGTVISEVALPPGGGPVEWDGTDSDGVPVPHGVYRFEVEAREAGEVIGIRAAEVYARVQEVRLENGAPVLVLEGGDSVQPSEVTGLRAPG